MIALFHAISVPKFFVIEKQIILFSIALFSFFSLKRFFMSLTVLPSSSLFSLKSFPTSLIVVSFSSLYSLKRFFRSAIMFSPILFYLFHVLNMSLLCAVKKRAFSLFLFFSQKSIILLEKVYENTIVIWVLLKDTKILWII